MHLKAKYTAQIEDGMPVIKHMISINFIPLRAFLKTPEGFSGTKVIFETRSLLRGGEVFSPKTSAKWLVDLRFYCSAF